jgi:hypothetical protein
VIGEVTKAVLLKTHILSNNRVDARSSEAGTTVLAVTIWSSNGVWKQDFVKYFYTG